MSKDSEQQAMQKVVRKYNKLYTSLTDLVEALQKLEPGGTLVDDITFTQKQNDKVSVAYIATPIQLTINTEDRRVRHHRLRRWLDELCRLKGDRPAATV